MRKFSCTSQQEKQIYVPDYVKHTHTKENSSVHHGPFPDFAACILYAAPRLESF